MNNYLICFEGKGRLLEIPQGFTSDQWGELQKNFLAEAGGGKEKWDWPDTIKLWDHDKVGNVFYEWELAGPDGASYRIIKLPDNTLAEIATAKRQIRYDHDVVRMSVIRINTLI